MGKCAHVCLPPQQAAATRPLRADSLGAQDGYSTARAFRAREEQRGAAVRVPIVACSAEVDAGDGCGNQVAERCRLAGMDDCVVRPQPSSHWATCACAAPARAPAR